MLRAIVRALFVTGLAVCCNAALPFSPAVAGTVTNQRPLLFSFDGSDSSIGAFTWPGALAVDESTGSVYVTNMAGSGQGPGPFPQRAVCKFDSEGKAQTFSAVGESCLDGSETPEGAFGIEGFFEPGSFLADVAVDNSAVNPGRIYVSEEGGPIHAFAPDGTYLWTLSSAEAPSCGIAVDREGHLWVGVGLTEPKLLEFPASGSPPAVIGEVPLTHKERGCRPAVDSSGKVIYVGLFSEGIDKYVEGGYDATLTTQDPLAYDLAIDQTKPSGHPFAGYGTEFSEYEPCEAPGCVPPQVSGSPFGGDLIAASRGIAYNPLKDRVYVSDTASKTVKVFGPKTSGTVPDVSCQSVDGVDLHAATAHCTINPLGLPNRYHFEWKEGSGSNWGPSRSSPAQSVEPSDSSPHSVSFAMTKLKSNKEHQVRLVGTNAENGANSYSNAITLKTLSPPPPHFKECEIANVDTTSAELECRLETFEEETTWQVQRSTEPEPECKGGWVSEPLQTIEEGKASVQTIAWHFEGLLPAQHYCVRVVAIGPGGETVTEKGDFVGGKDTLKTLTIPPSEAGVAFAGPRLDTSARINARINPEGEADLSYRFEWSEDGASWEALPLRLWTATAREPIVISEELTNLQPGRTYRYRLAVAENEAGPALSLGAERAFTTRSSAEVSAPDPCPNQDVRQQQHSAVYLGNCRGIELVNSPDKGNQNAAPSRPQDNSPMSADGEKVLWKVAGGAPKATSGTQSTFLAKRTEKHGWESESVVPPVQDQIGGGDFAYTLLGATPDLETYVFNAARSVAVALPEPPTLVRIHEGEKPELLKSYKVQPPNPAYESLLDRSDSGEAVFFIDNTKFPFQLEDVGSGTPADLISVMPDGSPSKCGMSTENESFGNNTLGYHWVATSDGSRAYFRVSPNGACNAPRALYLRNREAAKTTLIAPDAQFIRASPDGRQAYFLTADACRRSSQTGLPACEAPESADANGHPDVYRWDEESAESSCLTCVVADADVAGRVLISDDFSHIYFESKAKLIPGAGNAGSANLYVLRNGQLGFVASASLGFFPELSRDGRMLLFRAASGPGLVSDPMAPECIGPRSQKASQCVQLYLYEDGEESLECLSCRHDAITSHSVGSPGASQFDFRLSGDGSTVAFATQQGLLEKDVNHDTDIYEWRSGATHLITDGVNAFQVEVTAPQVLAVNSDGRDILFALVAPSGSLTGFERDGLLNIYDARIGGGFIPPAAQAHCLEDSCQGPLQAPPPAAQLSSPAGKGRGNGSPPSKGRPCAHKRGKAKQKCVRRYRGKAHRSKRGGAK